MQINEKQLAQVNHQIQRLIAADNFYGKRLKEAGVDHVSTVEEFLQLPFSEKQDLREAYPLGLMTCKEDEVVRIHSSSGTTGMPVISGHHQRGPHPYHARLRPLDSRNRFPERLRETWRNGNSYGTRQH